VTRSFQGTPVNAVYRKVEDGSLWTQLALHKNDWANIPRNKKVPETALQESGDIFTPDENGNLRRIQNPDGTPIEIDFQVKPDKIHRVRNAYRNGKFAHEVIEENIREMEKQGLISPAPDPTWGSSLLVVPKADTDDVRLTVDYRGLNECIEPYSYPTCIVHDIHSRIVGATRFTTLDTKSWFWQFGLSKTARYFTTFVTPTMGAWFWNVLPMGLNISPAIVQSQLDHIFRTTYDGPGKYHGKCASTLVLAYMDDVVIFSDDYNHAELYAWVLRRLRSFNVQVAPKKAFVGRESIHLLGHIVDKHGLHVDMTKVDAMSKMPAPTDAMGVKRFLGAAGYYRNFVTDFSSRTSHLTNLLKKTVPFKWTKDCQSEFDDIKKALVSAPVLALPRWDLRFVLRCDASDTVLGVYSCRFTTVSAELFAALPESSHQLSLARTSAVGNCSGVFTESASSVSICRVVGSFWKPTTATYFG
jgi:hypothetical protein